MAAVLLLGKMGPPAVSTLPMLQGLTEGPSPTMVIAATLSIAAITGDRSAVPAAMVKVVRTSQPDDWVNEMMLQMMLEPALQPLAVELVRAVASALAEGGTEQEQTSLQLPSCRCSDPQPKLPNQSCGSLRQPAMRVHWAGWHAEPS